MTGPAVPGWDAATADGEAAFARCGYIDDSVYLPTGAAETVAAVLAAALPLVLAALEAEIRAKVTYSDEEDDTLDFVCRFVATYRKAIQ